MMIEQYTANLLGSMGDPE